MSGRIPEVHESRIQGCCAELYLSMGILQFSTNGALPSVARILASNEPALRSRGSIRTRTKPSMSSTRGSLRRPMAATVEGGLQIIYLMPLATVKQSRDWRARDLAGMRNQRQRKLEGFRDRRWKGSRSRCGPRFNIGIKSNEMRSK